MPPDAGTALDLDTGGLALHIRAALPNMPGLRLGPGRPPEQHPRCPALLRDWLERDLALLGDSPDDDLTRDALEAARQWQHDEATRAPWPNLVPLDDPDLPALPPDCLPVWAGAFARTLATSTETPLELPACMVLGDVSAATQRRFRLHVRGDHFEPLTLWLACALPPGNRKSAVQAECTAPLLAWEAARAREMAPAIAKARSTADDRRAEIAHRRAQLAREPDGPERGVLSETLARLEADADAAEVVRAPQLWTSDATPERLGVLLADHGERMAWLSSEAGIFDVLGGRYSKGVPNLDLALKAWSGDAERVDRAGRPPVFLRAPLLTVCLSPQPEVLRGLARVPGFRGRGLLARFLYAVPRSPLGSRTLDTAPVPEGIRAAYTAGLTALLDLPAATDTEGEARHTLELSPAALAEWHGFALAVEGQLRPGGPLAELTDVGGKLPGQAARLAGVLHAIEHAHNTPWRVPVSRETMARALGLAAVLDQHTRYAFSLMGGDPGLAAASGVWDWIRTGRRARVTVRDIWQGLRRRFGRVAELRAALDLLAEHGYLEIDTPEPDRPGRPPSPVVTVRPDLSEGWHS